MLRQAFAHCGIFVAAAIRRCPGSVSVPMCQIALSRLVPVEALVGRYPTNKLIGNRPLPDLRTFDHRTMRSSDVIRYYRHFRKGTEVPPLFLSPGYVTYLFLTRSPLNVLPLPSTHLVRLACFSHAASVRSEPGSNSSLLYRRRCPDESGQRNLRKKKAHTLTYCVARI